MVTNLKKFPFDVITCGCRRKCDVVSSTIATTATTIAATSAASIVTAVAAVTSSAHRQTHAVIDTD